MNASFLLCPSFHPVTQGLFMKKTLRPLLSAIVSLCCLSAAIPSTARASDTVTGPATVGGVVCNPSQQICQFVLNISRSNIPSCAGTDPTFIFQTNTEGGRGLLNLLLTAKVSAWQVTVHGTNTCATSTLNIAEELVDYVGTAS